MNYSQSANPNATNSELDAKKIVKNVQLNNDQFGELIQQKRIQMQQIVS